MLLAIVFADDRPRRMVVQAGVTTGRPELLAVNLSDKHAAASNRKNEQPSRRRGHKYVAAAQEMVDFGWGPGMYNYCTRRRRVGASSRSKRTTAGSAESSC